MPSDLIKYGFVAGELAPSFFGRTDLTKYDMAMAEAYNFFVDYRGGLSSRAGFEFVDYIPDYVQDVRTTELIESPLLFTFLFDPDVEYNFLGLICPVNTPATTTFSHSVIRFIQNGAYIKEPGLTISGITLANPAVITTSTAHGYVTDDWITFPDETALPYELRARTFIVDVITTTTFSLRYINQSVVDSTLFAVYTGGVTLSRILELVCDYKPEEYKSMCLQQYHDLTRITHPAHPIRNLVRSNDPLTGKIDEAGNVWHIENEVIGNSATGPVINSHTTSAIPEDGQAAQVVFAISSVYNDGSESIRGPLYLADGVVNYPATEGSVSVYWTADPLAVHYNVYRSIVSVSETLNSGVELGFVGQTKGTKFTDPNIIPDFTRTSPQRRNPFAVQPIAEVKITDPGTGYVDFTTAAVAVGTGTGFTGEVIVDESGGVVNINIIDGGSGYAIGDDQTGIIEFQNAGLQGLTPTIQVFEHINYLGQRATFTSAIPNLHDYDMGDKISSYKATGSWEVFEHINYGGASATISGNSADPWSSGTFHDTISSLRPTSSASAGSGAVALATVHETLGTYPGVSCVFQQRQIYGASYDKPTTIWGSQVKQFSYFDITPNLIDSDSYEFTLDTPSFSNIRHFIPTQGGLLVTTQEHIWVLKGDSQSEPITPTNATAIPQTYNGVGYVTPLKIGSDLLYTEGKGHAVRMLSYNEIQRVYNGDDRSILSNHLFGLGKEITSWAYQEEPFKLVWAVRSDGDLLAFTVVKNEDIYAWTPCGTRGQFLSVANIRENNALTDDIQIVNDRVYVVTQRYLQGRWIRMIERMGLRNFVNVEDAFCVDCGWIMPGNYMPGNLNIWEENGVWYAKTDTGDLTGVAELIIEYANIPVLSDPNGL